MPQQADRSCDGHAERCPPVLLLPPSGQVRGGGGGRDPDPLQRPLGNQPPHEGSGGHRHGPQFSRHKGIYRLCASQCYICQ